MIDHNDLWRHRALALMLRSEGRLQRIADARLAIADAELRAIGRLKFSTLEPDTDDFIGRL